jgi:protein-S-isoprenylcysteine O-methyltransferase Ste14
MNPDNIDFRILENPVLLVAAIFLMFIVFGVVIDAASRFLDHRMPRVEGRDASIWAPYVLISLVGLLVFIAVFPALFTDSLCDCDPPIAATLAMVITGIGTLVWWATALFPKAPSWSRGLAAVLGYSGFVGVLLFGLLRAIGDAVDIVG